MAWPTAFEQKNGSQALSKYNFGRRCEILQSLVDCKAFASQHKAPFSGDSVSFSCENAVSYKSSLPTTKGGNLVIRDCRLFVRKKVWESPNKLVPQERILSQRVEIEKSCLRWYNHMDRLLI